MSFLLLSIWILFGGQVEGTILRCSYSLSFVVGPILHALKLWGGWVVAYSNLVSAPVPFGFRSYWDLVGVGPSWFWDLGFGDRA